MASRHTHTEILDFISGDQRMLYASDRETGDLFYLIDGEADLRREHTRHNLQCVVPTCPTPELTTVARRDGRRQGFRHLTRVKGEGHAEGLFHRQAKAAIADWLRSTYPLSTVALEVPLDGNRTRVADVMLTNPDGSRIGFETQYASLSSSEWETRHRDYADANVTDVWLFGHVGDHLQLTGDQRVKLNAVHRATARAGVPLLWFNPLQGQLATASTQEYFPTAGIHVEVSPDGHSTRAREESGQLYLFPIGELTTSRAGASAPILTFLARQRKEAQDQEAAAIARNLNAKRAAAQQEARNIAFKLRVQNKATHRQAAWRMSPEKARMLAAFKGYRPGFIGIAPLGEGSFHGTPIYLPFPDEQWQSLLYLKFMHGKPDKTIVTITECAAHLAGLDPDVRLAKEAVKFWFHRMVDSGLMVKVQIPGPNGVPGLRYAFRDPQVLSVELAAAELRKSKAPKEKGSSDPDPRHLHNREREEHAAKLEEERAQGRKDRALDAAARAQEKAERKEREAQLPSVDDLRAAGAVITHLPAHFARPGVHLCHGCKHALSDSNAVRLGYHVTCAYLIPGPPALPVSPPRQTER
ncbi:competence protein CoiA family protein [Cryobacterium sp. GrIS_2_6]|uniref:competence protein CoiA family protein n=1 Tax=Cryobacterium sp. GrIS_2_6 TaxID=3162785 RepID=UPI002E0CA0CE|nr:hypothetical protein [Cryobacterium psychrotolerans]